MASSINPNNIDGTYPIAGQDNDSQGFRDNFTNIKTNFGYAENEISDLQSKVILKAALQGQILDNNMNDSLLYAAKIADFSGTVVDLGATDGTVTIDYSAAHFHTVTTTGSIALDIINWPVTGSAGVVNVLIELASAAHTVTLAYPDVSVNATGIQGLNPATNIITFAAAGNYWFQFSTIDGGSTITVMENNKEITPFNNSSEDLSNASAASLAVTASYFTTSTAETATLAAGVEGQIKTFAMYSDSGDMVITVTNAGWKSSGTGTITFNDIGDACTMQYINSKWFCIGNNGAVFA
jgi:hypothetical protein